ncbi:MAG: zinc ABC transporter substrate-binding protein [Anaerolineae bacterium]|nr:zinc ABC transporter substrate-binding protein [Anaerolineae bacterium]
MKTYAVNKRWRWGIAGLWVALALLAGCASQPSQPKDGKLHVTVSIVPQQYFVERIGGDYVAVAVMVEPGASPATYEPKPEQLRSLSGAVAYFSIGVPFENAWLDKIAAANSKMVVVDTSAGIERLPMTAHHHEGEAGDEEEEAEGVLDPHIWISPELVKVQARNIYNALVELDPEHAEAYKTNLDAFVADIDALEAEIRTTLSGLESKRFMVYHPAWGYFAADFGLEQIAIELGGQEPSAQELAELIEHARAENIRVIFVQPEFSTTDAETIAKEIGGEVLPISPLAPDWLDNLRRVAQTFADALE